MDISLRIFWIFELKEEKERLWQWRSTMICSVVDPDNTAICYCNGNFAVSSLLCTWEMRYFRPETRPGLIRVHFGISRTWIECIFWNTLHIPFFWKQLLFRTHHNKNQYFCENFCGCRMRMMRKQWPEWKEYDVTHWRSCIMEQYTAQREGVWQGLHAWENLGQGRCLSWFMPLAPHMTTIAGLFGWLGV